jgi:threonylcarbamoyladenosine tRNA methylthiotransferase MtaB
VRAGGTGKIRTASISTLGCKLNQAESYRVQVELASAGVDLVPFGEPCDLCIVNTCTVTHVADQQARQMLRRAARSSPGGVVVAMGCYAQVAPQEVAAVEGVQLVITSDKEHLIPQLEAAGLTVGAAARPEWGSNAGPDHRAPLPETRVRQFVKVQDGCDDYCTYCIVPFARGHSSSRPPADVVADVQGLMARGCREVVLTGVQIGAYGRDRYFMKGQDLPAPGAPLAALVRRLLEETEIPRIRISSIQPQDWSDEFLALFEDSRLCRHLHLPLQAGSDETLRRMARRYSTGDFARLVERVRDAMPDVAFTADMIVGFPGESDGQHEESVSFARRMGFADVHVFRYSVRRGTAASRMPGQVDPEVRKARSEELRAVAASMAAAFQERFRGSTRPVLWEEAIEGAWTGLTDNYLRVVRRSGEGLLGTLEPVHLETLRDNRFWVD